MKKTDELQQVIARIRNEADEDPERAWLAAHAQIPAVADLVGKTKHFTHSELMILTVLARADAAVPFKAIQEQSDLSQGMLSRYVDRLAKQKLIEKFHTPTNKKAVVLRTTSMGQEIGQLHDELHRRQQQNYDAVLTRYSDADLTLVTRFLNDLMDAREHLD